MGTWLMAGRRLHEQSMYHSVPRHLKRELQDSLPQAAGPFRNSRLSEEVLASHGCDKSEKDTMSVPRHLKRELRCHKTRASVKEIPGTFKL